MLCSNHPRNQLFGVLPKISRNIQDHGFLPTILKAVFAVLSPVVVFRSYVIYVRKLEKPAPKPRNSSFSFSWIKPGDASLIAQIETMEEWLKGTLHERLLERCACLAALDGETVVGFNLVNLGVIIIPILKYTRKLPPRSAWSEQIKVDKRYRKRGVGSELRYAIFSELAAKGIDKLYGGTQPINTASLELARKTGFSIFCRVYYLKIFSYQKWFYRRVRDGRD
jgi:GNAT superfamily N-acetyltransferase